MRSHLFSLRQQSSIFATVGVAIQMDLYDLYAASVNEIPSDPVVDGAPNDSSALTQISILLLLSALLREVLYSPLLKPYCHIVDTHTLCAI